MKKKTFVFVVLAMAVSFCYGQSNRSDNKYIIGLEKQAVAIVSASLESRDSILRARAIEVISNAKYKDLMPQVSKLMGDDYVPVRFAAIMAVGDMKYSKSKKSLYKLIEVADASSKLAAAYALARLSDKRKIPLIQRGLFSDDPQICANAAMLLGKLGDKDNIEVLYRVLADSKVSQPVAHQVAEALASSGDKKIYDNIWTMLISKNVDDRIDGISAMGKFNGSQAIKAIQTMLYDEELEIRLFAAMELAKLGDSSGSSEVLDVLTKPLWQIRQESYRRIEELASKKKQGSKDDSEAQVAARKDFMGSPQQMKQVEIQSKMLASMAIGWLDIKSLSKHLPELLNHSNQDIRLGAAQSVLVLGQ